MSVNRIRVHKRQNPFVMLDTTALNDSRLSFRAKGLHAYLMSKPDAWVVSIRHLARESPREGRDAIAMALKELESFGYIVRSLVRSEKGTLHGYETEVYETPELSNSYEIPPKTDYPTSDKPKSANPKSANQPQVSIDVSKSDGVKAVRIEKEKKDLRAREETKAKTAQDTAEPKPIEIRKEDWYEGDPEAEWKRQYDATYGPNGSAYKRASTPDQGPEREPNRGVRLHQVPGPGLRDETAIPFVATGGAGVLLRPMLESGRAEEQPSHAAPVGTAADVQPLDTKRVSVPAEYPRQESSPIRGRAKGLRSLGGEITIASEDHEAEIRRRKDDQLARARAVGLLP